MKILKDRGLRARVGDRAVKVEIERDAHLFESSLHGDPRSVVMVLGEPDHGDGADVEGSADEVLAELEAESVELLSQQGHVVIRAEHGEREFVSMAAPLNEALRDAIEGLLVGNHLGSDSCERGDVRIDREVAGPD